MSATRVNISMILSDSVAPIVPIATKLSTALLLGSSLPRMYNHSGNASRGYDTPARSSTGTEVHSSSIMGASRRLNRCEMAMPRADAAIIYSSSSVAISSVAPLYGKPNIGHMTANIIIELIIYNIV